MSKIHVLHADIQHIDKFGNVIWEDKNRHNILHDEGEQYILARAFATAMSGYDTTPANLYLGLDARSGLAEADTLTTISTVEPVGNGYARQALSTGGTGLQGQDFYITQPATYYQAQSKIVTFANTSPTTSWILVRNLFLCTSDAPANDSGKKLICSVALSATRTLLAGDSMTCALYIGMSE